MQHFQAHDWHQRHSSLIAGKTVVVVGTGGLGGAVIASARRLGLTVIAVNRSGTPHRGAIRTVKIGKMKSVLPKVLHAVAGFTGRGRVKTATLVDAGGKLPLVLTFVDTTDHIERVLPTVKEMAGHRLIVRENITIEAGDLE